MHTLNPPDVAVAAPAALEFSLARQRVQREAAFRLVYESYLSSGLGTTNPHGMRVTPYHLLDSTQIFVGQLRDQVVSTVTLVGDSEHGLPMEAVYPAELACLRDRNVALAEVSCLADRRRDPRRFLAAFCQLTRLMAQFARRHGIDMLLVAVHPRHARFYSRYLGFEQIGGLATCSYVENRPAVALGLDFARIDRERPACYHDFFGELVLPEELEPYRVSPGEKEFLSAIVAVSNWTLGSGLTEYSGAASEASG